jgi:hypothetical protein
MQEQKATYEPVLWDKQVHGIMLPAVVVMGATRYDRIGLKDGQHHSPDDPFKVKQMLIPNLTLGESERLAATYRRTQSGLRQCSV